MLRILTLFVCVLLASPASAWARFQPWPDAAGIVSPPVHNYLYAHGNPVNGIDPSGHEFTAIGTIISLATGESLQSFKAGKDGFVQWEIRDLRDQLLNDLSPTDLKRNQKVGEAGEVVWCNYLRRCGFRTYSKPEVSANGPDVFAGRARNGRLIAIIGEVKASESKLPGLAAMKWSILSGMRQMSYRWLDEYASDIVRGFLEIGLSGVTDAGLKGMLERGELDLYFMGALKHSKDRWTIRGFRLFHLGEVEVWGDGGGLPELTDERVVDSRGSTTR